MIAWWGPIIHEYYAATEGIGATFIDTEEWLRRPGSAGRVLLGTVRICAEDGGELPPGRTGTVYFERDEPPFVHHGDPERTRGAQHPRHGEFVGALPRTPTGKLLKHTLVDRHRRSRGNGLDGR
ncbi:hypothetical protein ACICHK_38900 [Streptomyces sp. AHU1]|uniref:hypothetical protein n=1 Tax=Streptomyces sp. AHU1 TaxID=3377215 RepID=UPI003877E352